jgi:hypothetical protein
LDFGWPANLDCYDDPSPTPRNPETKSAKRALPERTEIVSFVRERAITVERRTLIRAETELDVQSRFSSRPATKFCELKLHPLLSK